MASIRRNEETVTATIEQHSAGTRGRNIAVAVPVVAIGIIVTAIAFVVLSVVGLVLGLVLTAVATIDIDTAYQGREREPRKYSRVLPCKSLT